MTSFNDARAAPERAHAWFGFCQSALTDPALREISERVCADEHGRYTELFRAATQRLVIDTTDFSVEDALAL